EHLEVIEVAAMDLARQVFSCSFAEVRVASGAMANLYAFMATCRPGDRIIVPPPSIGGHVTHHRAGAAGLYGLDVHVGAADPETFSYDLAALADQAEAVKPALITIGTSLNLREHPVRAISDIARSVGASLLFDAAHACGMIASGRWASPLAEGADIMTMSTYKSLGGPAGGLVVVDDADVAARLAAIAYPGLTANFDIARVAALGVALSDWLAEGSAYGQGMVDNALTLAEGLEEHGLIVHRPGGAPSSSHQLALEVDEPGAGRATAVRLAEANLLVSDIGLPNTVGEGVRLGTPEVTRLGFDDQAMREVAGLIAVALRDDPAEVRHEVASLRRRHGSLRFTPSAV
ncbi:MAG: aminotransferase class I/II-fold pyridoxal phosphate-dependent enzyme, partial [Actinomycetota bacterium]